MHAGKRVIAVFLLTMLLSPGALALGRAYGGRGEDMLLEITEAGGGLFAAGMTASDDGDLSIRTRTGDAGWAMLLNEDGGRVWSYASAHTGLARMIAPAVLSDGRCSVVLTDEALQRAEWILLDDTGKALSRAALLPDRAEGETVLQYLLVSQEKPALAAILRSGDELRAVTLGEDGGVLRETMFSAQGQGMAASNGLDMLAWSGVYDGGLEVIWLTGERENPCRIALEGAKVTSVCDALMQADGSVLCCGEAEADGGPKGFLARVSLEGELLFAHVLAQAQRHVCQTETGFAAYGGDGQAAQLIFLDEDGGLLDMAQDVPADALDVAGIPGGAALLTHTEGRRQPQAVITAVYPRAQEEETAQENDEPEARLDEPDADAPLMLMDGYLVCGESDSFGVRVTCMDGSGTQRWSTRIPIHTAADALEWLCAAQLADGGVLLGGRYLTGEGAEAAQEGVLALLSGDGVLRRIEVVAGAGAVCALEPMDGGSVTLHIASGAAPSLQADGTRLYHP